jgi:hypothetical protein
MCNSSRVPTDAKKYQKSCVLFERPDLMSLHLEFGFGFWFFSIRTQCPQTTIYILFFTVICRKAKL